MKKKATGRLTMNAEGTGLSTDAMKALDEMVARRVKNTGETEFEARHHIARYFQPLIDDLK